MAKKSKDRKGNQMTITFGEFDNDVYDYLQDIRNASALVRHLVRQYMSGNPIPVRVIEADKDEELHEEASHNNETHEEDSHDEEHQEEKKVKKTIKTTKNKDSKRKTTKSKVSKTEKPQKENTSDEVSADKDENTEMSQEEKNKKAKEIIKTLNFELDSDK